MKNLMARRFEIRTVLIDITENKSRFLNTTYIIIYVCKSLSIYLSTESDSNLHQIKYTFTWFRLSEIYVGLKCVLI